MPVIVSFEYIGDRSASLPAPPTPAEVTIGYIYVYNPNSFDLSNWPVYVRFTQDNFSFSDNIHEKGNNLRFRSEGDDLLNYFLGEWYHGEFGEAFIQIPSLPANTTVAIKVNYQPDSNQDLSNFSAVALQILTDLYAEWRFCHPSNSTVYDSGGSNWTGKIKYVSAGHPNKTAAYFDFGLKSETDNDFNYFGGAEMPFRERTKSAPFTWEMFVWFSSLTCWSSLMNTYDESYYKGSYLRVSYIVDGPLVIEQGTADEESTSIEIQNLTSSKWYHIVGIFSDDYISLHINGSNASAALPANHTNFNSYEEPLRICLNSWGDTLFEPGTYIKTDYARMWEKELSQSEIDLLRNHYSVATSRFPNKVCVLNWTEDKPQVFIECS